MNCNTSCSCGNPSHHHTAEKADKKTGLTDYSPKDKPWNTHRANTDTVASHYATDEHFAKRADRMNECAERLDFHWAVDKETGEARLKLKNAQFCRVPGCPVCQWRRSQMWKSRFYAALPKIIEQYPTSRWLFLTLTVVNPDVTDLAAKLELMNKAWGRFTKRKEFKPVQGWIRTTEVTQGEADPTTAHPHFHCLLMVPASMLSGVNYVKREVWRQNWRDCIGDQSITQVDIRKVKPKKGVKEFLTVKELIESAVADTLKYSVKEADLTTDRAWFLELMRQLHKKRLIASGGALKDVLKAEDETNADLVGADGESLEETSGEISFNWQRAKKAYHKRKD